MNLEELNEIFDDNEEEIVNFLMNTRTYTIQEKKDYFVALDDAEFFSKISFKKRHGE